MDSDRIERLKSFLSDWRRLLLFAAILAGSLVRFTVARQAVIASQPRGFACELASRTDGALRTMCKKMSNNPQNSLGQRTRYRRGESSYIAD